MAYQDCIEKAVNLRKQWFVALDETKNSDEAHNAFIAYTEAKMRIVSLFGKSSDIVDVDIIKCYRRGINWTEE